MSMVNPSIDYLEEKVGDKFTLCILASKRARKINDIKVEALKIAKKIAEAKFGDKVKIIDVVDTKEARRLKQAFKECIKEELRKMNVEVTEKEISVALKEISQDVIYAEREEKSEKVKGDD